MFQSRSDWSAGRLIWAVVPNYIDQMVATLVLDYLTVTQYYFLK